MELKGKNLKKLDAYNRHMYGIDKSNQMLSYYSCPLKTIPTSPLPLPPFVLCHVLNCGFNNNHICLCILQSLPFYSFFEFCQPKCLFISHVILTFNFYNLSSTLQFKFTTIYQNYNLRSLIYAVQRSLYVVHTPNNTEFKSYFVLFAPWALANLTLTDANS